ncbi:MAG: DsrE family protein [Alphaproteobacteria bacterium]|nr:DsrE family protein [Alphaproteobacteria bacterium]
MKALNIIETAYRATLEEQDDPVVWITHAMKGAGADLTVLLRGNAVNYVDQGQSVTPLSFGAKTQSHGPDLARDVAGLPPKGVEVYVVREDLVARGIGEENLVDGIQLIASSDIPGLFDRHDQVWHW